ncbi:MAG: uracil-DNA glycosylase family protein [Neisseria sp.]|nr:uracil-DNA glycosylase family protein [Neisseria sp.]
MLSSRYLHLHEALGLGPMWLKQGAKLVRPSENRPAAPQHKHHIAAASDTPPTLQHDTAERAVARPPAPEPHTPAATRPYPPPSPAPKRSKPVLAAHEAVMAAVGSTVGALRSRQHKPSEYGASAEFPHSQNGQSKAAAPATGKSREDYLAELGDTVRPAKLMVVSVCPSPEDLAAGRLFSGQDGILLDNMLAAIGLAPEESCRLSWLETAEFKPGIEQVMLTAPRLSAAQSLAQARAVLFLGQFFEQNDLNDAIDAAFGTLPSFTVPHPARLLRQPQLKAEAWAVLKKLKPLLAG